MGDGSKRFSLNKTDFIKLGKGLALAAGGAVVTYLAQWTTETDFGSMTPVVTAASAFVLNFARKWIADHAG